MHSSRKKLRKKHPLWGWASRNRRDEEPPNLMQLALDSIEAAAPPVPSGFSAERGPPRSGHGSLYRAGVRLSELRPGECGTIRRFLGTQAARLRLMEMGLIPGVHVRVIRAAAFGGPIDLLVRGYQLSLRREEAALIWLGEEEDEVAADEA